MTSCIGEKKSPALAWSCLISRKAFQKPSLPEKLIELIAVFADQYFCLEQEIEQALEEKDSPLKIRNISFLCVSYSDYQDVKYFLEKIKSEAEQTSVLVQILESKNYTLSAQEKRAFYRHANKVFYVISLLRK